MENDFDKKFNRMVKVYIIIFCVSVTVGLGVSGFLIFALYKIIQHFGGM